MSSARSDIRSFGRATGAGAVDALALTGARPDGDAGGAQPAVPAAPAVPGASTWAFSGARVMREGERLITDRGVWLSGRVIEADARSAGEGAPLARARLRVELAGFAPARDLPGQPAGRWYLTGSWRLADTRAATTPVSARYSPAVLGGTFTGASVTDPAADGRLALTFRLPWNAAHRSISPAEGTFSGTTLFEGQLLLVTQDKGRTEGGPQ